MRDGPIIVAHRGLHDVAGENTLEAFEAATLAGIEWVECDIWASADGEPVVIHDATVDGTTRGSGRVNEHSVGELRALGVPTLSEVLELLSGRVNLLAEIKPAEAFFLVAKAEKRLRLSTAQWMIQSFHAENVGFGRDSWVSSAFLIEEEAVLREALKSRWKRIHVEHELLSEDVVWAARAAGMAVAAWTVNRPGDIQRMLDLGIDMIVTDEPLLAAEIIARR